MSALIYQACLKNSSSLFSTFFRRGTTRDAFVISLLRQIVAHGFARWLGGFMPAIVNHAGSKSRMCKLFALSLARTAVDAFLVGFLRQLVAAVLARTLGRGDAAIRLQAGVEEVLTMLATLFRRTALVDAILEGV